MDELEGKIRDVEKMALITELKMAIYVDSAAIIYSRMTKQQMIAQNWKM